MRLQRQKRLLASIMPAATHRKATRASRQLLTARGAANGAHHVLGDVGAGERSTKFLRQLQPDYSQDFVEAFEDAGRYAGPLLVESTREIADQFFQPCRRHRAPKPGVAPDGWPHGALSAGVP